MPTPRETLATTLKTSSYSLTSARITVFEALLGQEPMAMHELVTKAAGIDRASVYRAVELFEKLGIVQRLNTGWKYKIELSDLFTGHHHHLTCVQCGSITPIDETELEAAVDRLARSHGFRPTAHQIELQGYCKNCQPNEVS